MNLIITTKCDKGCDYCFARESRNKILKENENTEMSLKTLIEILNITATDGDQKKKIVKLLGGEPTQHPEFLTFLDEIHSRGFKATIISNFLFKDESILEGIKNHIKKGTVQGFLLNATDLDVKDRIETYAKNYNEIYTLLYAMDRENDISPGITFSMNEKKDSNYYKNYVNFLNKYLINIERLRLSISFPGDQKDKDKFSFIHNKELGNRVLTAVNELVNNRQVASIDCAIYRCMFENKEEWKFINKFTRQVRSWCGGNPFDVFPDMTASKCYPLKETVKVNLRNYKDVKYAYEELTDRYNLIRETVDYPHQCKTCKWHGNECEGPCLGFFDLSETEIGINV